MNKAKCTSARKCFVNGTHRLVSPAETLAKVQPLLADMGITRIANVTGLDRIGIPVVTVMRPNSRSVSVSQGKGITIEAAKASGVMEAVESCHAERIDHPLKLASQKELGANHNLADVEGLARLPGGRFHPDLQILWIEGVDLISNEAIWLPYEVVHTNYTVPAPTGSGCFVASTNGLASGNHIQEAIAHGMAEVIERDSNTLWNLMSQQERTATRLDLDSVEDEACRDIINRLHQAEMAVAVWDMTSDVGVASFYCLIKDKRVEVSHTGAGAGTHPVREIALSRAMTEAVQVRANYITGARDDLERGEYEQEGIKAKLAYADRLLNSHPGKQIKFTEIVSRVFETFPEDVNWMIERLEAVGIEQVLFVDLTRTEFDLPVARIVIPGLEGPDDHEDYCPGARAERVARGRA